MLNKSTLVLFFLSLCIWPKFVLAAPTNYIYPLSSWRVTTHQGEKIGADYYHMGVDAGGELPVRTPVYAVADGVVREAQIRSQFGLVVLIEHQPIDEEPNVSLYGHLSPNDVQVLPGQTVKAGDIVGVLGNRSENGGWGVHLHFGIYKGAYTGQWVYYGHVHDPATTEQWHDPETYIPTHLVSDTWKPIIDWQMVEDQLVGDIIDAPLVGDIGSGIQRVRYYISSDAGQTWTLLKKTTDPFSVDVFSLAALADGPIKIQAKAKDTFGNITISTQRIMKDSIHFKKPLFVTVKTTDPAASIIERSIGNTILNSLVKPASIKSKSSDVTIANNWFVVGRGTSKKPGMIRLFNEVGEKQGSILAFPAGSVQVTSTDVDGDGQAEIIVGSNTGTTPTVKAFHTDGTLVWQAEPFGQDVQVELDVASGDVDGNSTMEIIVGARTTLAILSADGKKVITTFKPFGVNYQGGLNVAAGDVDYDGTAEIIVGTRGSQAGTVRIFDVSGNQIGDDLIPFGNGFSGEIGVATGQWDLTADAEELIISQASIGEPRVKVFRFDENYTVLFNQLVYDEDYTNGVKIVGL